MTVPANAAVRELWARMWRIRLACLAMRVAHVFADLAEWLLPEDLKRRL